MITTKSNNKILYAILATSIIVGGVIIFYLIKGDMNTSAEKDEKALRKQCNDLQTKLDTNTGHELVDGDLTTKCIDLGFRMFNN